MSKVINYAMKGRTLLTSFGKFQFDANGACDVPEDAVADITSLKGYHLEGEDENQPEKITPAAPVEEPVEDIVPESETPENEDTEEQGEDSTEEENTEDIEAVLAGMNVPQLKKYAKDRDIDLGDASKKDEIVKVILAAE